MIDVNESLREWNNRIDRAAELFYKDCGLDEPDVETAYCECCGSEWIAEKVKMCDICDKSVCPDCRVDEYSGWIICACADCGDSGKLDSVVDIMELERQIDKLVTSDKVMNGIMTDLGLWELPLCEFGQGDYKSRYTPVSSAPMTKGWAHTLKNTISRIVWRIMNPIGE